MRPANAAVARNEGVLHGIPNPNMLLSPLHWRLLRSGARRWQTQAVVRAAV